MGWDGNMRCRVPGTAGLTGADRWDNIMKQILSPAAPRNCRQFCLCPAPPWPA
jgi:hypothetical protein